jgi:fermentation-respiration switch protein FrsA (DUF1100 family)
MEEEIRFAADGVELVGRLWRPAGAGPYPLVVLCHGFSATMAMGLADYARVFVDAGLACLAYDHRNFGASGGEPRFEIDPWRQVADLRDAVSFARCLPGIDPARIGLWGTSYAGGHVIVAAALDRRVACVVSQVPLVEGYATLRAWIGDAHWDAMQQRFAADRDARWRGEPPRCTQPARPGDQTWTWVERIGAQDIYPNRITQRSLELIATCEPAMFVARVAPTPLMMILATGDTQTPYAGQRAAFERAGEPRRLVLIEGGHYDPYTTSFDTAAGAARDWFAEHLLGVTT